MSVANVLEASIVVEGRGGEAAGHEFDAFLNRAGIALAPGERPSTRRCAAARDRHHPERNLPISGPAGLA